MKYAWTSPKLRTPKNLVTTFKSLKLLQNLFQLVTTSYHLPLQFVISRVVIGTLFILVKYHQLIHPILKFALIATIFVMNFVVFLVFLTFSRVQYVSSKCIKSWRHRHWLREMRYTHEEYFKRFISSCKPIGVQFGIFYCITPKTALMYLISIARGTVRLLIATKSH